MAGNRLFRPPPRAKSLEALRTQGLADSAETKLLDQLVSTKLSIAVIGNHGPVRRSVLCALAHHAGAKGTLSVAGLAGPYTGGDAGSED